MNNHDILQRFIFEKNSVRGEIVRLKTSYQAISDRHPYPLIVKRLLGETLATAALLSATIKFDGSLILQMQTDGAINLLVAQSHNNHTIRGLAKWQSDMLAENFSDNLGKGHLALTLIPKQGERYQGIVAVNPNGFSASIEDYFLQSEQLPTCLILASNEDIAAGFLLQTTPEDSLQDREAFWQHVVHLAKTLKPAELLNLPNEKILYRLFHEENIRLFEPTSVNFRCDCSIERMENAIKIFGYEEAQEILQENKFVSVNCEFCNHHYEFDKVDIERIFSGDQHLSSDKSH